MPCTHAVNFYYLEKVSLPPSLWTHRILVFSSLQLNTKTNRILLCNLCLFNNHYGQCQADVHSGVNSIIPIIIKNDNHNDNNNNNNKCKQVHKSSSLLHPFSLPVKHNPQQQTTFISRHLHDITSNNCTPLTSASNKISRLTLNNPRNKFSHNILHCSV